MNVMSIAKVMPKGLVRGAGRAALILKKHSPEILTGLGIVGGVTSGVLACKATLKVEEVLDAHDEVMSDIAHASEIADEGEYTEEDAKKDKVVATVQTGAKLVKLYAPSVILAGASIGCIVGGHGILTKRNAALISAYSIVEGKLKEYRKRVVDEFGDAKDKELYYGLKSKRIEVQETNPETGRSKKVKKDIQYTDPTSVSQYARFFDDASPNWCSNPEMNLLFLRAQQNYCNDLLHARGHLFLNEVYDLLGIPRTKAGAVVGWIEQKGNDNFVDFGIYSIRNQEAMDFVNGYESSILLDFNVDGVIFDLI